MNIYFVVEGVTEANVYPAWISQLLHELTRVNCWDEAEQNNYYLFSSAGIPDIYNDIINSIGDINDLGRYDYFVICIDADAATVAQREEKILKLIKDKQATLPNNTILKIIVQNRCIETWLLGNRKVYARNPKKDSRSIKYTEFYNVCKNDPELMDKLESFDGSISAFHSAYLRAMFNERNTTYSKSNSREVQKSAYLYALISRVQNSSDIPPHLTSFSNFFEFCGKVRHEINT